MGTPHTIILQLESEEYERLASEGTRLGISPAILARNYIQAGLSADECEVERRRHVALDALDRAREITADLPAVDALRVAQESRQELEARLTL